MEDLRRQGQLGREQGSGRESWEEVGEEGREGRGKRRGGGCTLPPLEPPLKGLEHLCLIKLTQVSEKQLYDILHDVFPW